MTIEASQAVEARMLSLCSLVGTGRLRRSCSFGLTVMPFERQDTFAGVEDDVL